MVSVSSSLPIAEDDCERVRLLESLVNHFLGHSSLRTEDLRAAVNDIERQKYSAESDDSARTQYPASHEEFAFEYVAKNSDHSLGELSQHGFAKRVCDEIQSRLGDHEASRLSTQQPRDSSQLMSKEIVPPFNAQDLPPNDVADFLIDAFFDFAQTNSFFAEREWVLVQKDHLYIGNLVPEDAPWICSVLSIMAIGTQFAYLANNLQDGGHVVLGSDADTSTEVTVGTTLYQMATKLIPDVLAVGSVQSMQAFLLLARFSLSIDPRGLANSYIGVALRIATQNGMHRKCQGDNSSLSTSSMDSKSRLWWTAFALDRRISILHGMTNGTASSQLDERQLVEGSADISSAIDGTNLPLNEAIMLRLTQWLGTVAHWLNSLRYCPEGLEAATFMQLLDSRLQYKKSWSLLAVSQVPILQLDRSSAHLHLCYHLNLLYLGRPFIFKSKLDLLRLGQSVDPTKLISDFINDAEFSSYQIIDICAMLDQWTGLANSSYVETSSLQAAVLVMFAQSLSGRCKLFTDKLALATELIRKMGAGETFMESEDSLIDVLDEATNRLKRRTSQNLDDGRQEILAAESKGYSGLRRCLSQKHHLPEVNDATDSSNEGVCADMPLGLDNLDWDVFDDSLFEITNQIP